MKIATFLLLSLLVIFLMEVVSTSAFSYYNGFRPYWYYPRWGGGYYGGYYNYPYYNTGKNFVKRLI